MTERGVFCRAEWLRAWAEAFGAASPGVDESPPFPVRRDTVRLAGMPVRRLRGPANEHVPWLQLPESLAAASPAWPRGLLRSHAADMLVLPLLRGDARTRAMLPPGLLTRWQPGERAPYVDCTGSWEDYWAGRGGKTRAEWARAERRLREHGVALVCHRGEADLDAALDDALAIEADGWKGDEGSAIAQDSVLERFYRRVARDWARDGRLRLYFLESAEQRIAFQLCVLDGRQLISLKIGFARAFARLGPGQALQLMILRALFADPHVERFDLLGPETEHKLKWATGVEQLWTVRCYRPGVRGAIAALRWSVLPALRSRLARRFTGPQSPAAT